MSNILQIKIEHPVDVSELLETRKKILILPDDSFASADLELLNVIIPKDAYIAKNGIKLDISKSTAYTFAKENVKDISNKWWFEEDFPEQAFIDLKKGLEEGHSLIVKRGNTVKEVLAPEDAKHLTLELNLGVTWRRVCQIFLMRKIDDFVKWARPVSPTEMLDIELIDNWGEARGKVSNPDELSVSIWTHDQLRELLDAWCEEVCDLARANPYNYFEVYLVGGVIHVEMLDDIRGIQASMNEIHRLAMLETEQG